MSYDDRVFVDPTPLRAGSKGRIQYQGLLAKAGADKVYLHYGVDGWRKPALICMDRIGDRFETEIKTTVSSKEIDFCFKDSADHWDNNSGMDWKMEVV